MYDVVSETLTPHPTLVRRARVVIADLPVWFGVTYEATMRRAAAAGVAIVGPPFARYAEFSDDACDVEAGFPVSAPVSGEGEVVVGELPGGSAAVTWHVGAYDQIGPAYEAVEAWIVEQGGTPVGAPWETYHTDPDEEPDVSKHRTHVVQPYTPA
jgi:effector-binding domain-containing protein